MRNIMRGGPDMNKLKLFANYIPLASFIIFVVASGIASAIASLVFVLSSIGLWISEKRARS